MLSCTGYAQIRFVPDPSRRAVWREIARYLQRYIPDSGKVLELGSGYCDLINSVRAAKRWALDLHLDPEAFAEGGVIPLRRDVVDLSDDVGIRDGELDVVLASNLLEHLSDDKLLETTRAVHRKLKIGGRLILIQPNFTYSYRNYFDDYTHCRVFTHVSLADFLRSEAFEIERVTPRFLPFTMKSRLPKWPLLVRLYLRSPVKPLAKQMLVVGRKAEPAFVSPGGEVSALASGCLLARP